MNARTLLCALLCGTFALTAQTAERQPSAPASITPDTFRFREDRSRTIAVVVTEVDGVAGITWPDGPTTGWDTALLGVTVTAVPAATTPFVEIAAGGQSDRQYFRPEDAGHRWLNLSFLREALAHGTRVTLGGEGVTVTAGAAAVHLFSNGLNLSRPMLVLAPHPDDAEIAAFGIYAHRNATVVTVTSGNAGPPTYEAVFDDIPAQYQFKGQIRLIDSITVPWLGGIPPERTFNMGYFDARLAEMHGDPTKPVPEMYGPNTDLGPYLRYNIGSLLPKRSRASTWANLVDDLEGVLKKVKPVVIVAPHPQLDTHRDHQFTMVALAEALVRWKKRVALLLYTNHADQNRYPYGPAGTLVSLPPPPAHEVVLDRVYSHPVSPDLQRLKLFALESMHDLRLPPSRMYQLAIGDDRALKPEKPGPQAGVNYLRRGPRSNELFFVYDQDSVKPMIEAFLATWRSRTVRDDRQGTERCSR